MRRLAVGGGGTTLVLLLLGPVLGAAEKDNVEARYPSARPNPFVKWFSSEDPEPSEVTIARKPSKPTPSDTSEDAERPASRTEEGMRVRQKEEEKLHRRWEVCLRLKQVASETNDPELRRMAEQLEQRAWEVYAARIRAIPGFASSAANAEELTQPLAATGSDKAPLNAPTTRPARSDDRISSRGEGNR